MVFKPDFAITSKLLRNIKEIAVLNATLNNKRFSKTIKMRLEKKATSLSAYASTNIEGNPLPLTAVKQLLKNKPEHVRDSEKEVLNYNTALNKLKGLMEQTQVTLDKRLILDIHKMVINDLLPKEKTGRFRNVPVVINNPKTEEVVFLPPDLQDVPKLMQELITFLKKNRTKIDPLLLAGIFHKQFVIIHPFVDGNGRSARLLTKVLLADMGLNTFNLFSFENFYNKNITKYFENVGVFGNYYAIRDSINFTKWLEYFTDGIIDELLRVSKELFKTDTTPETTLKKHDKKILKYLEEHTYITDAIYTKYTDRAKSTRALDFDNLIKLGFIRRKGKGKATHYVLV